MLFIIFNISMKNYFIFKSIISKKLKDREIKEICILKNTEWKFGIKSQLKWFDKNIKKFDIHNLFYIKSTLVGYTALKKKRFKIKNSSKKNQFLQFDTLVIKKKYRKFKLSRLLMNFNNLIIIQSGLPSILICEDRFLDFYKKNSWKLINKKMINIVGHPFSSNVMSLSKLNLRKKYTFYFN